MSWDTVCNRCGVKITDARGNPFFPIENLFAGLRLCDDCLKETEQLRKKTFEAIFEVTSKLRDLIVSEEYD